MSKLSFVKIENKIFSVVQESIEILFMAFPKFPNENIIWFDEISFHEICVSIYFWVYFYFVGDVKF